MTYEEIVDRVREDYENADARAIFEHIAVQFNIEGEGSGIFYIEVADRKVCVEPYDYYDKDALVVISSETLMALSKGTMTTEEALEMGLMKLSGNREKLKMLRKIVFKRKIFWQEQDNRCEKQRHIESETEQIEYMENEIICWLTGYSKKELENRISSNVTYKQFFDEVVSSCFMGNYDSQI